MLEFVIQLFGEVLTEMGPHSLAEPFRGQPDPRLAAFSYTLFGLAEGTVSVWLLPGHMVASVPLRYISLAVTPVAVGLCMFWPGAWRRRRGEPVLRIDRFWHGFLFAVCMALVRFFLAR